MRTFMAVVALVFLLLPVSAWSQGRVVGGGPTTISHWPYLAAVAEGDEPDGHLAQYCAGSVITRRVVLTAAHCTIDASPRTDVIIGRTRLSRRGGQRIRVRAQIASPIWDDASTTNDFALLLLARPTKAPTVALAESSPDPGTPLRVAGWGATREGGDTSDRLRSAAVSLLPDGACQAAYKKDFFSDSMLCAGLLQGGKDACQGDSGGPLVQLTAQGPVQVGITSWGEGCARANTPGVYSRISRSRDWIMNTAQALSQTPKQTTIIPIGTNCQDGYYCIFSVYILGPLPKEKLDLQLQGATCADDCRLPLEGSGRQRDAYFDRFTGVKRLAVIGTRTGLTYLTTDIADS